MPPRVRSRLFALFAFCALVFSPAFAASPRLDPALTWKAERQPRMARPASAGGGSVPSGSASVIVRVEPGTDPDAIERAIPGLKFRKRRGRVFTADVPFAALDALADSPGVRAVRAPTKGRKLMDVVRSETIQSGAYLGVFADAEAGFGADGTGVVIGTIDTGIDYTHQDFITAGGATRVLNIWDQTMFGSPPAGYGYGAQWTQAQINNEIDGSPAGVVTQTDTDGHGTHVAGIAASNGRSAGADPNEPAGTYVGMAPGADIIAVKTDFDEGHVCDAIDYIAGRAAALPIPEDAVINMSLGFGYGAHDGTDPVDECVDDANDLSDVVVVAAAGNEQDASKHASATVASEATETFQIKRSGSSTIGTFSYVRAEFWYTPAANYDVTVTLGGLSGTVSASNGTTVSNQAIGAARVWIAAATGSGDPLGRERVLVEVETNGANPTSVNIGMKRRGTGGTGRLDGYTDFDYVYSGSTWYWATDADPTGTLSIPGTSNKAITVGAYATKNCWVDTNNVNECWTQPYVIGGIAYFSSTGPTRDGRQKPDVSAPGTAIAASKSANYNPGATFITRSDRHMILQGTSMAAPVVAGWAALARQTFPAKSASEIKARVLADARVDGAVAVGNTWGAGKLAVKLKPRTAPTGGTATANSTSQITFTWGAVTDATAYDAYDGINQGTVQQLATTSPLVFTSTAPNILKGLFVKGRNQAGQGPGLLTAFSATFALPYPSGSQTTPSVTTQVTSMDVTYNSCVPISGRCNGYIVEASQNNTFPVGQVLFSSTTNTSTLTQRIIGLTSGAQYYVRIGNLNQLGVAAYGTVYGPFTQQSGLVQPDPASFSNVGTAQIQQNWTSGGNAFGTTYRARAFSNAARTVQVGADQVGLNTFSSLHTSLAPGTQYWFRVIPEQGASVGPARDQGPQSTLAAAPVAAATPLTAASATQINAAWLANGNGAAATYELQSSPVSDFSSGVQTVTTAGLTSALPAVAPNTLRYARVRSVSYDNSTSAWVSLGSARSLAQAPSVFVFSAPVEYGFTAGFDDGGNTAGATFRVEASRAAAFNLADDQEFDVGGSLSASFASLQPATQYFFRAAAYNSSGILSAYSAAGSNYTMSAPPVAAAQAVTARTTTSVQFAWAKGLNPAGLTYRAELYADAAFSGAPIQTITAAALSANFNAGLSANTVYYARVRAQAADGDAAKHSSWLSLGSGSTLAIPLTGAPALAAGPNNPTYTHAALTWPACAAAPQASACEGYKIEASTDASFNGTLYSQTIADRAATGGTIYNLPPNKLLNFRVGPVNWDGASNPTSAGTGTTLNQNATAATTGASGANVTVVPVLGPVTRANLDVPGSAFPNGTVVTVNTSVEFDLPGPVSNQARLTQAGAAAGVELSAGGLQPGTNVRLTLAYNQAGLPAGMDERQLQLARYDPDAGQWTLLPTSVDPVSDTVTAWVNHFSLFGLFGVTPASALDNVQLFPVPWDVGGRDSRFTAVSLTISNLPSGARVRIFTIGGELVWEGSATANGILNWHGNNRFGTAAASGTYLVVVDGAGTRITRRAVLIR